jgi:hypothetical protein
MVQAPTMVALPTAPATEVPTVLPTVTSTPPANPTPTATATATVTSTPDPTATSTKPAIAVTLPAGRLRLNSDGAVPTGSFDFQIDALPPAADGSHYELWLRTEDGTMLDLGALPVGDGPIRFSGSTEQHLLAHVNTVLISLESDQGGEQGISKQIVLSSTLPADLLKPIRLLYFGGDTLEKGSLTGAVEQSWIAANSLASAKKALADKDLAAANLHVEEAINVIVGERSQFYNDWDRNGQVSDNPGDGNGMLTYLEDAIKQAGILSDTLASSSDSGHYLPLVRELLTSASEAYDQANHAYETAIKVITADTPQEAQPYVDEAASSVAQSQQSLQDVSRLAFELAEFRHFSMPGAGADANAQK